MSRKPVRGRFFIKIPLDGGGSYTVESDKDKSIDPVKMVEQLRHYADFITEYFVSSSPAPPAPSTPPGRRYEYCEPCITTTWCSRHGRCLAETSPAATTDGSR
ncbi:MAG: hypothetical protein GEV06_19880 [Luteitalea sp.]|nr:hypothetical protein [Luteitalea sp.]